MSHRHHSSFVQQVNRLIKDVNKYDNTTAESLYGIQIRDDGTVFDTTYQLEFVSIHEWAEYTVELDNTYQEHKETINRRHRFDDEE